MRNELLLGCARSFSVAMARLVRELTRGAKRDRGNGYRQFRSHIMVVWTRTRRSEFIPHVVAGNRRLSRSFATFHSGWQRDGVRWSNCGCDRSVELRGLLSTSNEGGHRSWLRLSLTASRTLSSEARAPKALLALPAGNQKERREHGCSRVQMPWQGHTIAPARP